MAADQERAERIRSLKQARPDLTWRRIADFVGVTERAAADWQKKGGIDYANAEKLAELFEVDVDYIWRGPKETAPDLFGKGVASEHQVDGVAVEFRGHVGDLEDRLDAILDYTRRTFELLQAASDARHRQQDEIIARVDRLEKAIIENGDSLASRAVDKAVDQVRELVAQPDEVTAAIEALAAEFHADADRREAEAKRGREQARRGAPRRSAPAAK